VWSNHSVLIFAFLNRVVAVREHRRQPPPRGRGRGRPPCIGASASLCRGRWRRFGGGGKVAEAGGQFGGSRNSAGLPRNARGTCIRRDAMKAAHAGKVFFKKKGSSRKFMYGLGPGRPGNLSAAKRNYPKTAGLKFRLLQPPFSSNSTQTPSSFFQRWQEQAAKLNDAKSVPESFGNFKPALFHHFRAAVHRTRTRQSDGGPPIVLAKCSGSAPVVLPCGSRSTWEHYRSTTVELPWR